MNSVDTILNFVWAFLCIGALAWHFWRDRKAGARKPVCSWRTLSVILAAVSLFPCISATDDRVRLTDIDWSSDHHQAAFGHGQPHRLLLSFQLEDPEHGQTVNPLLLAFVVFCFLILRFGTRSLSRWFSTCSLGRSPPLLSAA